MNEQKEELFELYKIMVNSADKNSDRRMILNNLLITLNTGLLAFIGAMKDEVYLIFIGNVLGFLLLGIWYFGIKSYKNLNQRKFKIINEIEENFLFQIFKKEHELKQKIRDDITWHENGIIIVFLIIYLLLSFYFVYKLGANNPPEYLLEIKYHQK